MKQRSKEVHLVLALHQFRNINLASKGCYKVQIETFTHVQYLRLAQFSNHDLQGQTPQSGKNVSTKVHCHSDDELKQTVSDRKLDFPKKGTYFTLPFFVKYHCQRVKLKSVAMFTQVTDEDVVEVRLTLWKKETKLVDSEHFEPLESVQFSVMCGDPWLCHRDILLASPECCSLKVVLLSCPLVSYEQIYNCSAQLVKQSRVKKPQRQELLLEQIRKLVKKQRYEAYILRKQLCDVIKDEPSESIKLPLHFVEKSNMSMDEVQTDELRFFKYLAFYEKYHTSSDMLKQEIQHINFHKVTILKGFVDGFKNGALILSVLQEKEKLTLAKKYKTYLVESERRFSYDKLLEKYSQEQFKAKKEKIKKIDAILGSGVYSPDQIQERGFLRQKQPKRECKEPLVQYPLVFRDACYIDKENKTLTEPGVSNVLQKKSRRKKKFYIFAHGFQGLPADLSNLINMIRFANERVKTLVLRSYKNNMDESIELMAVKVGQEIETFLKKVDLAEVQPQISLIGHSMGPIILRAALRHLTHFSEYFDSFISICSPHLGYIQGTKFLTEAGLSIISKLKPIESLNQLSNRDSTDLEKTFIYRLSQQGSLKFFKRIVLVASMEDDYVPWHSARIEPFLQNGNKEKVEREMICNIFGIGLKERRIERIERIEVNFPHLKQKSLNSFIGRTSHIKPLNDRGFLEILARQLLN